LPEMIGLGRKTLTNASPQFGGVYGGSETTRLAGCGIKFARPLNPCGSYRTMFLAPL